MPITGSFVSLTTRYIWLGQRCENVAWYSPGGIAFLTATAAGVAEAYWNNVKDRYRAMVDDRVPAPVFVSVLCKEYGGGGGLGEYGIPAGESAGTRAGATGELVTAALAGAMRLTVATTATRPGQKRFPFLTESDVQENDLTAPFLALMEAAHGIWDTELTLGAPVLAGVLVPAIVRLSPDGLTVTASQDVIGHVINPNVRTQVSRLFGRGR